MSLKSNKNLLQGIDNLSVKFPNIDEGFSTDSIQEYIPFLGMVWNVGTNTIVGDLTSREYKEIIPSDPLIMKVVEVNLEKPHPLFGGKNFYRVTKDFYEDNYRSSNDFYRWERFRLRFKKEELFYNRLEDTFTKEFDSLKARIYPNKALGLRVKSDHPFSINVRGYDSNLKDTGKMSPFSQNYLTLYLTKNPQKITIEKYGTTKVQGSDRIHPLGEDINYRDTLIHLRNAELKDRLKPPGKKHFKDDFINTKEYEDREIYIERDYNQLELDTITVRLNEKEEELNG